MKHLSESLMVENEQPENLHQLKKGDKIWIFDPVKSEVKVYKFFKVKNQTDPRSKLNAIYVADSPGKKLASCAIRYYDKFDTLKVLSHSKLVSYITSVDFQILKNYIDETFGHIHYEIIDNF